jgi:hypothetical protein
LILAIVHDGGLQDCQRPLGTLPLSFLWLSTTLLLVTNGTDRSIPVKIAASGPQVQRSLSQLCDLLGLGAPRIITSGTQRIGQSGSGTWKHTEE